jgi:glucose/arabinose dehydrogenase
VPGAALVVAAIAAIVGVVAVGGAAASGAERGAAVPVGVQLTGTRMTVSRRSVPTGPVVFSVRNASSRPRDFEIVGKLRSRLIVPGATASFAVRFTTAGTKALRSTTPSNRRLAPVIGSLRVLMDGRTTTMISHLGLTLVGKFASPTFVVAPPGDTSRLLVVQQNGLVSLIENGVLEADPFLDLRSVVRADGEKGLLSLAFAPDYATSGLVYAYFNNRDGNVRLIEYHRSATDPDTIDRSQRRVILALVKPTADHNGGMMQFGPDGDLYVGIGDGGAAPPRIPVGATGQTLNDLFGDILRIDPRKGSPYAVPATNPFVSTAGARPEIVAYGLRNPWRFWIDPALNEMLIGDVGEGAREEIDVLPLDKLGLDFGWPCEEGTTVPDDAPIPASCKTAKLTPPVWQYPHSSTRCSITGGVVVRDPRLPQLAGRFLWSDLCDGRIYALDPLASQPSQIDVGLTAEEPTSFGTDASGRVYVATVGGAVYRIDPR